MIFKIDLNKSQAQTNMLATLMKAMIDPAIVIAEDLHFLFFIKNLFRRTSFSHFLHMNGSSVEQGTSFQPSAVIIPQCFSSGLTSPSKVASHSGVGEPGAQSL